MKVELLKLIRYHFKIEHYALTWFTYKNNDRMYGYEISTHCCGVKKLIQIYHEELGISEKQLNKLIYKK